MAVGEVVIKMDRDDAALMLGQFNTQKDWLEAELRRVGDNIAALDKFLNPSVIQTTLVFSSTDRTKLYQVTYDGTREPYGYGEPDGSGYGYSCTCPSFQFKSGVDSYGWCKHIKRVIDEGRFIQ